MSHVLQEEIFCFKQMLVIYPYNTGLWEGSALLASCRSYLEDPSALAYFFLYVTHFGSEVKCEACTVGTEFLTPWRAKTTTVCH